MKISKKYMKLIEQEIKSPLTTGVTISRNLDTGGTELVIRIRQVAPVELYGTAEMRKDAGFIPFYQPMDIPPPEVKS